jgi:hypothetical protein
MQDSVSKQGNHLAMHAFAYAFVHFPPAAHTIHRASCTIINAHTAAFSMHK